MSIVKMSKSHPYRIQLHCDKVMHGNIQRYASQRGLSQSGAARILIERELARKDGGLDERFDEINNILKAILHASVASRILSAESAQFAGSNITAEELSKKIALLIQRYMRSQP